MQDPYYQRGYPTYGQPPPQVIYGGPVPVQSQPNTVVVKETVKDTSAGDAAAAGCCGACLAILCCCCLAAAGSGGHHYHRGYGRRRW